MGQFKPMVKMETTEPSVELKLKKGGAVKKAMGGSMIGDQIPAMSTMPGSLGAPRGGMEMAAAPKKPSMAKRKKAMAAKPAAMKEGGESKAQHKAEMNAIKGVKSEIKTHASKPASKAHKGLATGGVVMGNAGGFKKGGKVQNYAFGGGVQTSTVTSARPDTSSDVTGGVKLGNAGGFKKGGKVGKYAMGGDVKTSDVVTTRPGVIGTTTGAVTKGNAGGFKKGGAAKKFAEGGSVQNDGGPRKMPQGNKPPSKPVSISKLSGAFKKGGTVKKMAGGGSSDYDPIIERESARMQAEKNAERADNEAMREAILGAPKRLYQGAKRMMGLGESSDKEPKSITKTEKSVTVSPGKKRGGAVC
jgi:hypothetical protein